MTHLSRMLVTDLFKTILLLLVILSLGSSVSLNVQAQRGRAEVSGEEEGPLYREYRGIQIGMLADEVRKKLGSPADKGEEQDFFVFSEKETAQILYDKGRKVITISVDYLTGADGVPTSREVFGADLPAKPDGSIYKMVRYKKAGCWLSYNRTAGNQPLVTVTIQKLER